MLQKLDKSNVLYLGFDISSEVQKTIGEKYIKGINEKVTQLVFANGFSTETFKKFSFGSMIVEELYYRRRMQDTEFLRNIMFNLSMKVYIFTGDKLIEINKIMHRALLCFGDDLKELREFVDTKINLDILYMSPVVLSEASTYVDYDTLDKIEKIFKPMNPSIYKSISHANKIELIPYFDIIIRDKYLIDEDVKNMDYSAMITKMNNDSILLITDVNIEKDVMERMLMKRYIIQDNLPEDKKSDIPIETHVFCDDF